jgi:transcriptional regulator with XRE-family HTH domain
MKLQEFLKRTKRTQRELANELGISTAMVSLMKHGKNEATRETCRKLLLAGMTVEELFGADVWEVVRRQAVIESPASELTDEQCRAIVERGIASLRSGK